MIKISRGGGMADTQDLKSCDFTVVRVRLPPAAHPCRPSSMVEQLFCPRSS